MSQLGSFVLSTIVVPTRMVVLSSGLHLLLLRRYTQLKSIGYPLFKKIAFLRKLRPLRKVKSYVALVLDSSGILRVGGRDCVKKASYSSQHPVILSGKHPVTKLMIRFEHLHLLLGGPTLPSCSLNHCFYILGGHKIIWSIICSCVICRRTSAKPQHQMLGQLPIECVTPDLVFDKVGVDYAGPFYIKYGHVRKPTVVKTYASVFVSLSVKAVHLEQVSELTTETFLACLRCFISR